MRCRTPLLLAAALLTALSSTASAQGTLSASERDAAVARVRAIASCVERHHAELQRIVTLIRESETQRERARDEAVRRDAERAIEALVGRAADLRQGGRDCFAGPSLPNPGAQIVERDAPADAVADAVGESGHSLRTVEADVELASHVHVVRGEQVDGAGRVEVTAVRTAMRGIATQLERCSVTHVARGTQELELVFALRAPGRASSVEVERSGPSDAALDRCVLQAGQALRLAAGPSGGEAVFSYRLRFGRR